MGSALHLKAALKGGALLTAANWPLIVVQFAVETLYKLALAVPIAGGAVMVAALAGGDMAGVFAEGIRAAVGTVVESLAGAPFAVATFLLAVGLVAVVGAALIFLAKAGTMAILARGEPAVEVLQAAPLRGGALSQAAGWDVEAFLAGVRRLGRRYLWLGAALLLAYLVIGGVYLLVVVGTYAASAHRAFAWPLLALLSTTAAVVAVAAVNLVYDLLLVIIAADDCGIDAAGRRLWGFLAGDARHVLGIFGVLLAIELVGGAASLVATGGLGLVAWVPVAGLLVFPLQAAAWLLRGLVFEFIDLSAMSAYLTQYRRFTRAAPAGALETLHL